MTEEKSTLQSMREWVVEHKLRAVGTLWLTGVASSIAYNWSRPGMKTSVKIIHARFAPASCRYQPASCYKNACFRRSSTVRPWATLHILEL
ncbi:hypothetical protein GUJ93_ZPchr0013g35269 [Zizania palustris]|uniref:HIG1 domain-containing protein n=1 Tax=Zizania palustris TaxID=103762 RepID=A0A8J5X3G0_ZIZPA|nr:hypothetical protein GUJ93_ZPchr0013g35269 [Zizania palustris]